MDDLHRFEEVLLLALHDEKGTVSAEYLDYGLAAAILGELLLAGRIELEGKRSLVNLVDPTRFGVPLLDDTIQRLAGARRRATLRRWVSRVAAVSGLRRRAARGLVERGVLKNDERRLLGIFRRTVYPELDPLPERQILQRLEAAIAEPQQPVDPETILILSLADALGLLRAKFGAAWLRGARPRIDSLVAGDRFGNAIRTLIEEVQVLLTTGAVAAAVAPAT